MVSRRYLLMFLNCIRLELHGAKPYQLDIDIANQDIRDRIRCRRLLPRHKISVTNQTD